MLLLDRKEKEMVSVLMLLYEQNRLCGVSAKRVLKCSNFARSYGISDPSDIVFIQVLSPCAWFYKCVINAQGIVKCAWCQLVCKWNRAGFVSSCVKLLIVADEMKRRRDFYAEHPSVDGKSFNLCF